MIDDKLRLILKFFSLIFSYPNEDILREAEALARESGIRELLELVDKLKAIDLKTLQIEYTNLFITSYPTLKCPPYESFYREGKVYGESAVEVRELYRRYGLEYTYASEPPDHVSVELEFLALTGSDEFLERLRTWLPKFLECIKNNSKIYEQIARTLEYFISRA